MTSAGLDGVPMFAGCTDAELAHACTLFGEVEFLPGEVVVSERDICWDTFVIVAGEASMVARNRSIARLGPGDFFGWMARLSATHPRSATVTAITPMRCLVAGTAEVRAVLDIPSVARTVLGALYVCASEAEEVGDER